MFIIFQQTSFLKFVKLRFGNDGLYIKDHELSFGLQNMMFQFPITNIKDYFVYISKTREIFRDIIFPLLYVMKDVIF